MASPERKRDLVETGFMIGNGVEIGMMGIAVFTGNPVLFIVSATSFGFGKSLESQYRRRSGK